MNNVTEIKPPAELLPDKKRFEIFLAGSIEQGKAEEWQHEFADAIRKMKPRPNVALFNPRRDNWDPSWSGISPPGDSKLFTQQVLQQEQLVKQIEWEIEHLERAHLIVMYLQPGTISPVSMLELGIFVKEVFTMKKQMIVLCPEGFHRKTNIDVVCQYYDVTMAKDMTELIKKTKERIKDHTAPKSKKLKFYK